MFFREVYVSFCSLTNLVSFGRMFPHMNNSAQQRRLDIVRYYIKSGDSLRKTAQKFKVSYRAVFKWVKLYKEHGEIRLLSTYKKPWNRIGNKLEESIVLFKEYKPALTIRKTKDILQKEGITISQKGIYGIWKRYGYTGFHRENMTYDISEYAPWTEEAKEKFKYAEDLFKNKHIKKAAKVLNTIPLLPQNDLIVQVPDIHLNLKRRIDKMIHLFGEVSLPHYLKKTERLYELCKREKLYYQALRIGVFEVLALGWAVKPKKMLARIAELKKIAHLSGNYYSYSLFGTCFPIIVSEGTAYGMMSKIEKASVIAHSCRAMLMRQKKKPPLFMMGLANLYTFLEDKEVAEYWYRECLKKIGESGEKYDWLRKTVKNYLADVLANKGEYKEAIELLKDADLPGWRYRPRKLFYQSMWHLNEGNPHKTISSSSQALSLLKEKDIRANIFNVNFTTASAYGSLGEKKRAENILRKIMPYLKKFRFNRRSALLDIILYPNKTNKQRYRDVVPTVKLALLLKDRNYMGALQYAKKKGIQSSFYKYIFFFPDIVLDLLEKGKPTHLPRHILRLPMFNKKTPVYNFKFLSNVAIYKNQKKLKIKLMPKDCAFLIHFALKAGAPHKKIPLESLYNNFWANSKNQARNLSHLLVRIKRELKIPPHLFEVSYKKDEHALINKGIHFTTDYDEFVQTLAQAKAFQRAGEWNFAKGEFLHAFSLIKGSSFTKMYDPWSEDMRTIILNKFENEIINFVKTCVVYNDYITAKKIIMKTNMIIRYSKELEEIKKQLEVKQDK